MKTLTKEMQNDITPTIALELLKKGNERFINNLKINRNLLEQANATSDGQHPFAVILSCIDSRTSAELIFDQGLGDVFGIRIAGTVINDDILGSMEFSCKLAGAKIIVVLGHSKCGAIKGACDHEKLGNLTTLLKKIEPAIAAEQTVMENRTSINEDFVEKVTAIHVQQMVAVIMSRSAILAEMIKAGKCGIVAGHHDIATGAVRFYPNTMHGFFSNEKLVSTESNRPPQLMSKL